jgi:multidrug resistance protein, MATE family
MNENDPTRGRLSVESVRSDRRRLITLSWPIICTLSGDRLMGLVDAVLIGQLGARALGGFGVATALLTLSYSVLLGMVNGVRVRCAQVLGRGRMDLGAQYARAGMAVGFMAGLVIWAAGRDISWFLVQLGIEPDLVADASAFIAARTFGAPAAGVQLALVQYRQAMGDTRTPMVVGVCGNLLNAALAYGFLHGAWGLPALGLPGVGYATAMADTFLAVAMLAVTARDLRVKRTPATGELSLRSAVGEVAALGAPIGLQTALEKFVLTVFVVILGGISHVHVAAHQVVWSTLRVTFLPAVALSDATGILVGRELGQGDRRRADRVMRTALALALGFTAICGVIFAFGAGLIVRGFTDDPVAAEIARRLLYLAIVYQIFKAAKYVLCEALRAAQDVRVTAAIGVAAAWVCGAGGAYVLGARAGWGAVGGWLGLLAEVALATALYRWRWRVKTCWR